MISDTIELNGQLYESGKVIRARYGLSGATLSRWVARGLLPQPIRLGKNRFFRPEEVEARLAQGE